MGPGTGEKELRVSPQEAEEVRLPGSRGACGAEERSGGREPRLPRLVWAVEHSLRRPGTRALRLRCVWPRLAVSSSKPEGGCRREHPGRGPGGRPRRQRHLQALGRWATGFNGDRGLHTLQQGPPGAGSWQGFLPGNEQSCLPPPQSVRALHSGVGSPRALCMNASLGRGAWPVTHPPLRDPG